MSTPEERIKAAELITDAPYDRVFLEEAVASATEEWPYGDCDIEERIDAIARKLADLIDPTVTPVPQSREACSGGFEVAFMACPCGRSVLPKMRYCPQCGARIIWGDE